MTRESHDDAVAGLILDEHGVGRCWWAGDDPQYRQYHDGEWGRPVDDDNRLFEKICLEGFQAGLSWLTILRKRENFRRAFASFEIARVADFTDRDVERLLGDAGIVRHRGKIEATINNAQRAVEAQYDFGSLARLVWSFEPGADERPQRLTHAAVMELTQTPASRSLSRTLKKRGWRFVGPTTMYAFLQSMGLVNDHIEGCGHRVEIEEERRQFRRPD